MGDDLGASPDAPVGRDLACTVTAGIIRNVRNVCGEGGLGELLDRAKSTRTLEYLEDNSNWVSLDEVIALFEAGALVTGDDKIAGHVGEEAVRQYAGTPVATVLRSLGSVEAMLSQIATVASKFSVMSDMQMLETSPGRAVLSRQTRPGFKANRSLCDWAVGLLSAAPMLYGIPAADVHEVTCQARGAKRCLLHVRWDDALAARTANPAEHITALEAQLVALNRSFENMYAAAGDLIADDDLHSTLAKITERSATAVRAPRYLLVVRPEPDGELEIHHRGLSESEAPQIADRVLDADPEEIADGWLLADVRSHRRHYGRIAALFDSPQSFFPHERQTLKQYARYAANAIDRSIDLAEARRSQAQTRALLDFARSLSGASSVEGAQRLADAVPQLLDCDRVAVFLREEQTDRLLCAATNGYPIELAQELRRLHVVMGETDPELARALLDRREQGAIFLGRDSKSLFVQRMIRRFGSAALILAPIMVRDKMFGAISVAVSSGPHRLRESSDLRDRLSGIVAQAAVWLENGELIDRISHQAHHDPLTGLANRTFLSERFERALASARETSTPLGLFYIDLDGFKRINDEHGHAAGDQLLCQVAARLLTIVRAQDTVARLGGDEFAIILQHEMTPSEREAAASRIARALDEPFLIAGHRIEVRASIGCATWPSDGDGLGRLMREADVAMYTAKRDANAHRQISAVGVPASARSPRLAPDAV
jgi:diguanylate cyclase (GGDEF)-like protein